MKTKNRVQDLQDLTGQESGVVVYDGNTAIICNWSSLRGLPRLLRGVLVGDGREIEDVSPTPITSEELAALLDGVEILYDANQDEGNIPDGLHYDLGDVQVIAPQTWN